MLCCQNRSEKLMFSFLQGSRLMYQGRSRTSDIINRIIENAQTEENISIGRFIDALGERAFGLAVLLFALPNSLPIPGIPGFSTITGLPIIIFGLQMAIGQQNLWLPQRIYNYQFSQRKLAVVLTKSSKILQKMEHIIRPRLAFMLRSIAERFIGVAFFILGAILALPIPLGNFLPGISLSIVALGLVEGDGLIILVGIISGMIASSIISATIIVFFQGLIASLSAFF